MQQVPDVTRRAQPLLPPELPWLYLVIPLPAAYLMGHNLLDKPVGELLRGLLKMYLPFPPPTGQEWRRNGGRAWRMSGSRGEGWAGGRFAVLVFR